MARPGGAHRIEVVYLDGRTEQPLCNCDWCIAYRATGPLIQQAVDALDGAAVGLSALARPEPLPSWLTANTEEE